MKALEDKSNQGNNPLSVEEIKNYLDGNLSAAERRKIEGQLQHNSLNAEAMDGFSEFPEVLKNIEQYKEQLKNKSLKKHGNWWQTNTFMVAASVTALLFSISLYYVFFDSPKIMQNSMAEAKPAETTPQKEKEAEVLNEVVSVTKEIKEETSSGAEQKVIIQEEVQIEESASMAEASPQADVNEIEVMPLLKVTPAERAIERKAAMSKTSPAEMSYSASSPAQYSAPPVSVSAELSTLNIQATVPVKYIESIQVVDYAMLYPERSKKNSEPNHVDAKYENESAKTKKVSKEVETVQISYNDFLERAIKQFAAQNYAEATKDFNVIITHFPGDVNCIFYTGLCNYNLGKYDSAIKDFERTIKNDIHTFNEEALWYKALCYEKKGDMKTLKKLLKEIVGRNGFYAAKAKEKLNK